MLPNYWKFQNRNVQTCGSVYHDGRPKSFPLERNLYGHPLTGLSWEKQFEVGEKKFQVGMLIRTQWKGVYSYLCMWTTSNWLERNKTLIPMWKVFNKEVDLGEPTSFFDHVYFGPALRDNVIWAKILWTITEPMFESRISAGATENLPLLKKFEYLFVVLWHGRSYEEMCGGAFVTWRTRRTQQLHKRSTPCIDDHHFKEEEMKSVGELSHVMLSDCSEMLFLGTYWKTRYSMVSEQTCTTDHKMDQSLWQTIISFDLLHSSYMWIQTLLSCG